MDFYHFCVFFWKHIIFCPNEEKDQNFEQLIPFFSRTIRGATSSYNIIKKQALALVKALKDIWVYIIHSHTISYVPNVVVNDVLMQNDPERRRGKLIVAMLEYDIEINPTNIVKGQGLVKLMEESNLHALNINLIAAMSKEEVVDPSFFRYHKFLPNFLGNLIFWKIFYSGRIRGGNFVEFSSSKRSKGTHELLS